MDFQVLWLITSFSFLMALTGAMSPGPLFTYTIIRSIQAKKHGYLVGFFIIVGHAVLEMGVIIIILAGFSFFINNSIIIRLIGIIGSCILIFFGSSLLHDLYLNKIPTDFLEKEIQSDNSEVLVKETIQKNESMSNKGGVLAINNPVTGGIFVSAANPYWWVWWATIGLATMIQFNISFQNMPEFAAFFLGHEMGDLVWYFLVSSMAFFGKRAFNKKIYYGILAACGLFMIIFGLYLGITPLLTTTL